jgi:hypothetical protein
MCLIAISIFSESFFLIRRRINGFSDVGVKAGTIWYENAPRSGGIPEKSISFDHVPDVQWK